MTRLLASGFSSSGDSVCHLRRACRAYPHLTSMGAQPRCFGALAIEAETPGPKSGPSPPDDRSLTAPARMGRPPARASRFAPLGWRHLSPSRPPFSAINCTPAASKANVIARMSLSLYRGHARRPKWEGELTPARSANSCGVQSKSPRAARHCAGEIMADASCRTDAAAALGCGRLGRYRSGSE